MNSIFQKLKIFLQTHKIPLISRGLFLLLVLLFIKVNRIQIQMNPPEESFEKVTPVDYEIDRSRLVCYARRIPVEIQKICDGAFPEGKRE
ncbi:hypothetical protein [Leptospira weilii]|uniref:hypothetical protein n=1 Tax=Leptospira weilii TaxID=28184 RepID=UPI00030B2AD4|nr:hypothetical protein [Leptospira weilii]